MGVGQIAAEGVAVGCADNEMTSQSTQGSIFERRPEVAFLAINLGLLLLFFAPILTQQQYFYYRDISYYFEPFARYFARAVFSEGRFPLWNDMLYTGMPQIAVGHPHILYPFTWLLVFLPFSAGLAVYLILHLAIAGSALYRLILRAGFGSDAAFLCGTAMIWNGYMFALFSNFQLVAATTWIPVLLLALHAVDGTYSRKNLLRVAGSGAAVFLLLGSGSPEVAVPGVAAAALGIAGMFIYRGSGQTERRRVLTFRVVSLAIGFLFSAPLILPAIEWLLRSPRGGGLPSDIVLYWSTDWYNWLSVLCSHPLGGEGAGLRSYYILARGDDGHSYYVDSPYITPAIAGLALCGFFSLRVRDRVASGILLVVTSLIAAGSLTPVGTWLFTHVPGASVIRYPVKLIIFPILILIALAGRGVWSLSKGRTSRWPAFFTGLSVLAFLIGAWVLSSDSSRMWSWWHTTMKDGTKVPTGVVTAANRLLALNVFIAAMLFLAFLATLWLWQSGVLPWRRVRLLLFLQVGIPLVGSAFLFDRHTSREAVYPQQTLAEKYKADLPGERAGGPARLLMPRDVMPAFPERATRLLGAPASATGRYAARLAAMNTALSSSIPSAYGYEGAVVLAYIAPLLNAFQVSSIAEEAVPAEQKTDLPFARLSAFTATAVVMEPGVSPSDAQRLDPTCFRQVIYDADYGVRLSTPVRPRPRWYLSRSLAVKKDFMDTLASIMSKSPQAVDQDDSTSFILFKDYEPRRQKLEGFVVGDRPAGVEKAASGDRVRLLSDRVESLSWEIEAERGSVFVLADQYYPGWEAFVDGQRAEIFRVNVFNRGVFLPPGKHTLTMRYRPKTLYIGLGLAASGALVIVLLAFVGRWSRRG